MNPIKIVTNESAKRFNVRFLQNRTCHYTCCHYTRAYQLNVRSNLRRVLALKIIKSKLDQHRKMHADNTSQNSFATGVEIFSDIDLEVRSWTNRIKV